MKKWVLGGVVWAVVGLGAGWADEAGHRRAVADLFDLLGMRPVMEETLSNLTSEMISVVDVESGYQEAIDAFVQKYVGWDAIQSDIEDIYMRFFSEEDIRALIAFYSSPAGKKYAEFSPAVAEELSNLVQGRLIENRDDLIQMMMDADFLVFKKYLDESNASQPSGK